MANLISPRPSITFGKFCSKRSEPLFRPQALSQGIILSLLGKENLMMPSASCPSTMLTMLDTQRRSPGHRRCDLSERQ